MDFYCHKLKLIIEIDGKSHDNKLDQDLHRQNKLELLGFQIVRILDRDIKTELDSVIKYLHNVVKNIEENESP